jgi:hypothetical protein
MALLPVHYERISRIYFSAVQKRKIADGVALYGYDWSHSNFDWYKVLLHKRLRVRQNNRCCYCRRALLFNRGLVEIEHIIDKGSKTSRYSRFTFEPKNLALSCKDCNNNKGRKAVLNIALKNAAPYPNKTGSYIWVHPHLHAYSDHILIHTGWVYEAKNGSPEGIRLIKNCMLHKLQGKESSNRMVIVEGAANYRQAILQAAAYADEAGLENICRQFGARLSRIWKGKSAADVMQAIRDTYLSLPNP